MALVELTKIDGVGIHTLSNINSHNINSTGIITAINFAKADGSSLGGVESDSDQNTVGGTGAGANLTASSDQNTLFGYEAGNDISSGDYNTCIGHQAGDNLYGGDQNTAVGKNALGFEYNGDSNVAIGYDALLVARGTNHTTAIGRRSGRFLSSGNENILLGSGAGGSTTSAVSLTSGSNNIIIGYETLPSATAVSNEITLGNANITKLRIPGLNSFEISDAGVLSGTASAATSASGFRNVTVSTSSPSGGSDGDVWIKYS